MLFIFNLIISQPIELVSYLGLLENYFHMEPLLTLGDHQIIQIVKIVLKLLTK